MHQAIEYLVMLKKDLERVDQIYDWPLTKWLAQSALPTDHSDTPTKKRIPTRSKRSRPKPKYDKRVTKPIFKKLSKGPSYTAAELDKLWGAANSQSSAEIMEEEEDIPDTYEQICASYS